jgi:hypothetical protein
MHSRSTSPLTFQELAKRTRSRPSNGDVALMRSRRIFRPSLLVLIALAAVMASIFLFAETDLSLSKISWRHRFEHCLKEKGEVSAQQETELFPQEKLA